MSIKIGITGGIGSGKTVISHLLGIMGVPVYIADIEAKKLTVSNDYICKELALLLGDKIFEKGELNKPFLANYLFASPENAKNINNIIHPKVKEDFRHWTSIYKDKPIVAMESAILIESGFSGEVEEIIMVSAPLELRIARVAKRDSSSRELILNRINAQMADEEKIKLAHYIIINDGRHPLIPQLEAILHKLLNSHVY